MGETHPVRLRLSRPKKEDGQAESAVAARLTAKETPIHHTSYPRLLDRYFIPISIFLLAVMAAVQIGSALQENPTNDEPVHLASGYVYLTTGEYRIDLEHPPLGRILPVLPILNLPRIPPEQAAINFKSLIWGSTVSAETVIFRARLATIALTFLFGAWLAFWTRRRFGAAVALLALTFFAFDPTFVAHGHYVTTDLIAAFSIFLTCTLWTDFLLAPSGRRLAFASLALGFALVSKYSAVALFVVLPLLYGVAWWRQRGTPPFFTAGGAIKALSGMLAGASLVVSLTYAPDTLRVIRASRAGVDPPVMETEPRVASELEIEAKVPKTGPLSFGYGKGMYEFLLHSTQGHAGYLLGQFRTRGWWYYFPVAFLVKTPTAILIACFLVAISLWRTRKRPLPALLFVCLALPPAIFFGLAMRSSINIGVRHILPVYAFLYVLLAWILIEYTPLILRRAWPGTIVVVILLLGIESLSIYPHYLAFFNWPSGGPAYGSHYLLDSNIDWGQDLKNLGEFVNTHKLAPLCTALYSGAPYAYYGIVGRDLNHTGMPEGAENLPCVVAVSVNLLQGFYNAPYKYAPLRRRKLLARIGYSVYVYDLPPR
jgi:hypothetical protein